jgi:FtsP/CotA-like multicopper oxidase with cupredoxin domain
MGTRAVRATEGMKTRAVIATEGMKARDMDSREATSMATEGTRDRVMDPTGMAVTSSKVTTWSSQHSSGAHRQQQQGMGSQM